MEQKQLPEDFKDFIKCLNSNNVRYLLLGGWAVGIYGSPRATKDIDFLVSADRDNLEKLKIALTVFGGPPVDMEAFEEKGQVIRMGRAPIQIDIINEATGIDIEECYQRKKIIKVNNVDVSVISKEDLITNKKASGRDMDMADVKKLEKTKTDF